MVEGQERGIADALFVAQQHLKDEAGETLIDDTSIEMALTDIVNGGTTTLAFPAANATRTNLLLSGRAALRTSCRMSTFQFTNY